MRRKEKRLEIKKKGKRTRKCEERREEWRFKREKTMLEIENKGEKAGE